ncbi:MAG: hypothetical protein EOP22_11715 [Hyphomicrobiales bacterium]|nr:MAG: hypothetical protein EOP22_11715 [Hyphomicrobiales bacterium]
MLFRPTADQKLDAIRALLDAWNGEADRFRQAAIAARQGEAPGSLLMAAVEEAHDGLTGLLDEIERALDTLPVGHAEFAGLLMAQKTAIALLESVSHSHDVLDSFTSAPETAPTRIAHELRVAAE